MSEILIYQNENIKVVFEYGEIDKRVVVRKNRTTTEILNYSGKLNSCKSI